MTAETCLPFVKANLEMRSDNTLHDDYLNSLINGAIQMITREGITLDDTTEDINIVVMYAAYLYRKRTLDNAPMPRMLRYALNNRLFSQKIGEV